MFHLLTYLHTLLRAREEGDNWERATWLADWPMARYCCVSSRYDGQLMDCDDDPSTSVRLPEPPPPPLGFLQSTVVHTQSHTHTHTHTPAKYDKVGTGRGFDMRAMTAWHVIARNHAVLSATHTWNGPCQGQMRILSVQDWLRGFSGLFTDTSEHIHFYFLVLLFPLFCCWFRAVE